MTADVTVEDRDSGSRGILSKLRTFFAPEPPPAPAAESAPVGVFSLRRGLPAPIIVPARGYVFTFQVHVWLTWSGQDMADEVLEAWSDHFTPSARRDVAQQVGELSRHFLPHQAAELETNLNRRVGSWVGTYERSGMVLRVRPSFRVQLDQDVKEQLRQVHLQRLKLETEHEVAVRRMQMLDQLTRRWLDVIERLRRSPFAAAAAELSDKHLAEILAKVKVDERTTLDELAGRIREAIRDSNRVGQPLETHEANEIIDLLNAALSGADTARTTANGHRQGR